METITCPHCNNTIQYNVSDIVIICPKCNKITAGDLRTITDLATEEEILAKISSATNTAKEKIQIEVTQRYLMPLNFLRGEVSFKNVKTRLGTYVDLTRSAFYRFTNPTNPIQLNGYNDSSDWDSIMEGAYRLNEIPEGYVLDINSIARDFPPNNPGEIEMRNLQNAHIEATGESSQRIPTYRGEQYILLIPYVCGKATICGKVTEYLISLTPFKEIVDIKDLKYCPSGVPLFVNTQYCYDMLYPKFINYVLFIYCWITTTICFSAYTNLEYKELEEAQIAALIFCGLFLQIGMYFLFPYTSGIGRLIRSKLQPPIVGSIAAIETFFSKRKGLYHLISESFTTPRYFNIKNFSKNLTLRQEYEANAKTTNKIYIVLYLFMPLILTILYNIFN